MAAKGFVAPRPLRAAASPAALAAGAAAGLLADVPAAAPAALAGSLAILAAVRLERAIVRLRRARRFGDVLLRSHSAPASEIGAWRAGELTSPRNRRSLALLVRQLRRQAEACRAIAPAGVDREALEAGVGLLHRLEQRLRRVDEPVSAAGMLAAEALATGGRGPLSDPRGADRLPAAVARTLASLEA